MAVVRRLWTDHSIPFVQVVKIGYFMSFEMIKFLAKLVTFWPSGDRKMASIGGFRPLFDYRSLNPLHSWCTYWLGESSDMMRFLATLAKYQFSGGWIILMLVFYDILTICWHCISLSVFGTISTFLNNQLTSQILSITMDIEYHHRYTRATEHLLPITDTW